MVLVINKKESIKKIIDSLGEKNNNLPKKGNLAIHYGKLKRNIDGLEYQLEVRKHED